MAKKQTKADVVACERSGASKHVETLKKLRIVIRAAQRHSSWIEKHCGVKGAQLWIMQELHDTPGMRVSDVAARLAIHQTTTSNLLNALLEKGYIEKIRDMEDQRVVKLILSRRGATVLKKAPQPTRGLLPEALRKMDSSSLVKLNKGLDALLAEMNSGDESFALQPFIFNM